MIGRVLRGRLFWEAAWILFCASLAVRVVIWQEQKLLDDVERHCTYGWLWMEDEGK